MRGSIPWNSSWSRYIPVDRGSLTNRGDDQNWYISCPLHRSRRTICPLIRFRPECLLPPEPWKPLNERKNFRHNPIPQVLLRFFRHAEPHSFLCHHGRLRPWFDSTWCSLSYTNAWLALNETLPWIRNPRLRKFRHRKRKIFFEPAGNVHSIFFDNPGSLML